MYDLSSQQLRFAALKEVDTHSESMSQTTKRKHVVKEVLENFAIPTGTQQIVKIISSRGNNLHEVITARGESFLASMPTKFRKNIWIKRGDYVIVDPIEEGEKVKAEISFILYKDHIQYLQQQLLWPKEFSEEPPGQDETNNKWAKEEEMRLEQNSISEDDESDLFVNTNRCNYQYSQSEDEDEHSKEDDDKEEETGMTLCGKKNIELNVW